LVKLIRRYENIDDFAINALATGVFRSHLLFILQSEFIIKGNGDFAINFLGRHETLAQDFCLIAKRLSLNSNLPITNQGPSSFFKYKDAYKDDRAIKIISDFYAQDINVFGYQF